MAEGIRIQHPTERSCTFTLVDGSRPYLEPWTCPPPPAGCARTHQFKTYHLRLDEAGGAIVSIEIWRRLERMPAQPFRLANAVKEPPAQRVIAPVPLALRTQAITPGDVTHG